VVDGDQEILKPEEVEWLASWTHKPHGGAAVLSRILRQVSMPEYAMVAVDEQILFYVNLVGACERINRTAIPQAYTRYIPLPVLPPPLQSRKLAP
jgi:predicted membrane chloride channel (bestrophin family)